ncbi:phospho-sugar mutase [Christensenellaceae bacterium OttesenSCG-928-K19]|nr:phospho-sugar mutase [Christensenellaceae bacterium OttesenSCG-928-K19]
MADYKQNFEKWKTALQGTEYEDEITRLEKDQDACSDSFYRDLEFGTAGMRGIIGLGTNRMNIFTVRRATQGLADFINEQNQAHRGVAIAYDTRNMSDVFAEETASVLLANGIHVFMYDKPHSVPQLSFAVLEQNCFAGVVITASHNPPEYNGYKVYGEDGGQMATADSAKVTEYIEKIDDPFSIKTQMLVTSDLFVHIGRAEDFIYYTKVESLVINKDVIQNQADSINIVYTPLHGTGLGPVRHVLRDLGIQNLHIVAEQEMPDGDFPTVSAPNPENREAYDLATLLANKTNADLILATDPDCDRLGVAVRDSSGDFTVLTGNQIGCLLLHYVLSQKQAQLSGDEFVVKSLVSTDMADVIASHYGVEIRNVYTGFKFIAEQIKLSEEEKKGTFLFGFEESYGYLLGTFVRDKDAVQAAMMVTEMACYYADHNKTLFDALNELYQTYGWFREVVVSKTLYGQAGISKILNAVNALRNDPPASIGGFEVTGIRDYEKQTFTDCKTGKTEPILMDSMDVLCFELDGGRFIVRPSGTEPKLKTYLSVSSSDKDTAEAQLKELTKGAAGMIDALLEA